MASSTPSAPINSSRAAADMTAGRIYISTPSAQVRVPVRDLVFFPHFCSHYTTRREIYPAAEKLSRGGVKSIRRWNNYRSRAQVGQKFEKKLTVRKTVTQCRKYPSPYLHTLSLTIPCLYTLNRHIPYL